MTGLEVRLILLGHALLCCCSSPLVYDTHVLVVHGEQPNPAPRCQQALPHAAHAA
jgi:hypothetical protein